MAATLTTTPSALMADDKFEAAASLFVEMSKNIIYEQWSTEDEAVVMIAKEHLRRGDIETTIKVALAGRDGSGRTVGYLEPLFRSLLRQNNFDGAKQIASAMTRSLVSLGDRALTKLVKYLVDRGQLRKAKVLGNDIVGLPFRCNATITLAFAHTAAGNSTVAQDILGQAVEGLINVENRSWRVGTCAITLAGLLLGFEDQDAARYSAEVAAEMLNMK